MAKSKQRQSLRGAVLIMVFTVMVVLIIMLMATLTVVTTASQRVYTKFEENQAYYTARSALDVFTVNMLNDNDYYAYDGASVRTYSYTGKDTSGNPKIYKGSEAASMKQGLALQGEMYKIRSQGETTKEVALEMAEADASLGINDSNAAAALGVLENMYEIDDVFGSVGSDSCPENEFFTVSDSAINDDDDTAKQVDYIEYTVTLPKTSDGSNSYGLMVDTDKNDADGDGDKTEQIATIKVEVLDRIYHTSPNYTREEAIEVLKKGTAVEKADLKAAIKSGDRSKDFFKLKVTSTVQFMDTEGTAVLIYDSTERPQVNSSKAITSVNDVSEGSGLFALGGASSLDGNISVDEASLVYDSLFLKGNLNIIDSGEGMHLFKDTLHTVLSNFTISNTYPTFEETGSVFYVNGTTSFTVNGSFGTSSNLTNIVTNVMKLESNAKQMLYYGNMYCDSFYLEKADGAQAPSISGSVYTNYVDLTNYFETVTPTSAVLKFSTDPSSQNISTIASQLMVAKGIIVNVADASGNPVPTKFDWDGGVNFSYQTVYTPPEDSEEESGETPEEETTEGETTEGETEETPEETPEEEGPKEGDIITKTYIIDSDSGIFPGFTYSPSTEVKASYNNPAHYTFKNGIKEFEMPVALAGRTTKLLSVPTVQSLYGEIFKEDAFISEAVDTGTNGDLDNISKPVFDTSGLTITYSKTKADGTTVSFTIPNAVIKGLEDGSIYINSPWDSNLYTLVDSGVITEEEKNNVLNNWSEEQTHWSPDVFANGVKTTIINTLDPLKTADTTYQAALTAYYNNYILGAERAGENLLKYTSTADEITIITDKTKIATPEDFKAGGKYGGSYSGYITKSGYLKSSSTVHGTKTNPIVIDARTNEIIIQLGESVVSGGICNILGYFVVVGDNNVKFYLPDGRDYNLGSTGSGQGFYLSTYDIHKATELRLGSDPNATPVPHVYMYVGDNVENVKFLGPTGDRFFTGYIYAPFADFGMGADTAETFSRIYYNQKLVPAGSGNGFTVVGSLIAKSYQSGNKSGVAFINPNKQESNPGDAILAWKPTKYSRY